jgi:transcriptional regulator with XRE-family HTH domain
VVGVGELTPVEIGARVRRIRQQRGLTVTVLAGLACIDKSYLSRLERGLRRFAQRWVLEALAEALGCAVSDLTGQPTAAGRAGTAALAVLPPVSRVLADTTLADVPDLPARPVAQLAWLAAAANEAAADARYGIAGTDLAQLLLELHVHAVRGRDGATRRAGLRALVEACIVAVRAARTLGALDLAVAAADRAQAAAARLEDVALQGFAAMSASVVLTRSLAHYRAERVLTTALAALERADPTAADTAPAEAAGMLHLTCAQRAAKHGDAGGAATHLAEARALAARTGECTTLRYDFGPSNVDLWDLAGKVELGDGAKLAATIAHRPGLKASLGSADRQAALDFDLARGHFQDGGARDGLVLRHLDLADLAAPRRIRHDPLTDELLAGVARRGRHGQQPLLHSLQSRVLAG